MELRVLGSSGGWPAAGRPCSGYLLSEAGTRVWLDTGAGTLAELLRHHQLGDVDAIFISHLDPDHCSDLGLVRNAIAYGGGSPMTVLGPPGWRRWFDAAVPDPEATRAAFRTSDISLHRPVRIGNLTLAAFAVQHGPPTFGCRVESGDGVLAYSADSGPCAALIELARGADLFLCEAYLSIPGRGPSETVMQPEQAGSIAATAGARSLLLTHLHPGAEAGDAIARARTTYPGPVDVAMPGAMYQAGR